MPPAADDLPAPTAARALDAGAAISAADDVEAADVEAAEVEASVGAGALSPWRLAWPLGLSVAALVAVLWATYEPGAFALMRRAFRPGLLALAVGMLGAQVALGGLRLRYVSHGAISFGRGVRGQLTWDFMSAVTPAALGGGPFASVLIAAENRLTLGHTTALMLFLMLMDQVWFAVLIPAVLYATTFVDVFPASFGRIGAGTMTTYLLGMMAWSAFFAYATLIRPEVFERVAAAVFRLRWLRRFERRVGVELARMSQHARVLRGQPLAFFVGGVALSAAVWVCRYLVLLFVAWSVAPELHVVEVLFRAAALWLAALILPTPGGSGGMELLFSQFISPLLPAGFGGLTLVVWRGLTYYLPLVVGMVVAGRALHRLLRRRAGTDASGSATSGSATSGAGAR